MSDTTKEPGRGESNVFDGSGLLQGHHCVLKRAVSVSMFKRRCYQSPIAGAIPPPELQTRIHDHVTANHVLTSRSPGRVNWNLPIDILDIDAAQDNPSDNTMPLSQEPPVTPHREARDQARKVARKRNRYRH